MCDPISGTIAGVQLASSLSARAGQAQQEKAAFKADKKNRRIANERAVRQFHSDQETLSRRAEEQRRAGAETTDDILMQTRQQLSAMRVRAAAGGMDSGGLKQAIKAGGGRQATRVNMNLKSALTQINLEMAGLAPALAPDPIKPSGVSSLGVLTDVVGAGLTGMNMNMAMTGNTPQQSFGDLRGALSRSPSGPTPGGKLSTVPSGTPLHSTGR